MNTETRSKKRKQKRVSLRFQSPGVVYSLVCISVFLTSVLAIVNRSNTLDNEEGLRLLEDGGELEIPIEELDEEVDTTEDTARLNLLGRAADGVHGDGEMHKSKNVEGSSRPLVTIEEPEEFESDTPVIAGRQEEGRREVGGEGNRVEWRR
ncbi:hypothetical protein FRC14_006758 [Serendipita sp. 396]|nr:hypothetical protein FRC14_006758 [Serendipita sp. 396]